MKIEFLAAAREEFLDAVSHYDSKKQGLGDEFYDEVWRTFSRVVSHPFTRQPFELTLDKCLQLRMIKKAIRYSRMANSE